MLLGIRRVSTGPAQLLPSAAPGVTCWLRGDTLSTSGANVTQWTDKSSNANNFPAGAASPGYAQLVTSDTTINSRNTLRFTNSVKTFFDGPIKSALMSSTAFTFYCVAKVASVTVNSSSYSGSNGILHDSVTNSNGASTFGLIIQPSAHVLGINGDVPSITTATIAQTANVWKKFLVGSDGTNLYARQAGSAASSTTGATMANMSRTIRIGGFFSGYSYPYFDGWLAECAFFNQYHSTTVQDQIFAYQAAYFGF